jgi:hypothetical protein
VKHASGKLVFTLQQLEVPGRCVPVSELSALVPDRLEGPWSEEEVRELIQGWRMMAFCQEDEPVRAHPFHSADGLFRTVVFDTCPA